MAHPSSWSLTAGRDGADIVRMSNLLKPRQKREVMEDCARFQACVIEWFRKNGKDYPWRQTRDPYWVLVSEIMLQQTQVATVLGRGYYHRFFEQFPTIEDLARADDRDLLKVWEGLGYYRRVRMLRETAKVVVSEHGGQIPTAEADLLNLPGVGAYTVGALRAFAFDLPAVLVDGNIARVIARVMDYAEPIDAGEGKRQIWQWAQAWASHEQPRAYHSGLMEVGQTCCRPGVPDCHACPISEYCRSRCPEELPVKKRKIRTTEVDEHCVWQRDQQGRVLLEKEQGSRRTGLWKLVESQEAVVAGWPLIAEQVYAITRYRVRMRVYEGVGERVLQAGQEWVEVEKLKELAIGAPYRRAIEEILGQEVF